MAEVRTTHVGSLPRPDEVTRSLIAREENRNSDDLDELAARAIDDVVRRQADLGITVVNDGEQHKASYASYVMHRLTGFEGERTPRERPPDDFPDFTAQAAALPFAGGFKANLPACNGPIAARDSGAALRDVAQLKGAAEKAGVPTERLFMTAASPGLVASYFSNQFYPDRDSYLAAIVDAMRQEYRSIVDAGITLQLDCPDLASHFSSRRIPISVEEFRIQLAESVEALNTAIDGLPIEHVRLHVCWGNNEGPHHRDIELRDILDVLLTARPAGLVLESSNPRHAHEWQLFEETNLPDGKYLVPGVIDTTTNFIEHPELVAQRIRQFARLVGEERVIAGADCGFATWAGPRRVAPSIAWAKLESLVVGARLASSR